MTRITIKRALNLKNRLAERLKTARNLASSNSAYRVVDGQSQATIDHTSEHFELANTLSKQLVEIKTKIQESNSGEQYSRMAEMEELKSEHKFLNDLYAVERVSKETIGYRSDSPAVEVRVVPVIDPLQIKNRLAEIQARLDELTDAIESFNYSHYIELSFEV